MLADWRRTQRAALAAAGAVNEHGLVFLALIIAELLGSTSSLAARKRGLTSVAISLAAPRATDVAATSTFTARHCST